MGAYLTRFGSMFGTVPAFTGRVFFVAPTATYTIDGKAYSASDNNDGLAPERALLTVTRAVTLTSTGDSGTIRTNDTIVLLQGTHTVTATVTPKAGTRIMGDHGVYGYSLWKPRTTLTIRGTSDELLDLQNGDVEIAFLTLQGSADYSLVSFQTTSAINGVFFHNCYFDCSSNAAYTINHRGLDFGNRAGGTGIGRIGAAAATALATAFIDECVFETAGAAGEAVHFATCDVVMKNCRINTTAGTWATPMLFATNGMAQVENCKFTSSGGVITVAISGYHAGYAADIVSGARLYYNTVTASTTTRTTQTVVASVFQNFGVQSADLVENYVAGGNASFSDGGRLIIRAFA